MRLAKRAPRPQSLRASTFSCHLPIGALSQANNPPHRGLVRPGRMRRTNRHSCRIRLRIHTAVMRRSTRQEDDKCRSLRFRPQRLCTSIQVEHSTFPRPRRQVVGGVGQASWYFVLGCKGVAVDFRVGADLECVVAGLLEWLYSRHVYRFCKLAVQGRRAAEFRNLITYPCYETLASSACAWFPVL
ncbi:hypothetical protein EJ03DRAFT_331322 [Teratosphaeria nubilosa]|uniref:Uncharacterized protein n=1 Tax=Teratosphaeria nubilosa TaxID=161662 RepID=A0A6G1KWK0_9PEZI|nr:hypothetical protein EJ03DRAFT_331322 [Teratosphaeria nubilosa]